MRGLLREFPREIEIPDLEGKWQVWRIRWRRQLKHPRTKFAHGLCHRDGSRLIEIRLGLSREQRLETFWHEVMHAVAEERGFRLTHQTIYNLQWPLAMIIARNSFVRWRTTSAISAARPAYTSPRRRSGRAPNAIDRNSAA